MVWSPGSKDNSLECKLDSENLASCGSARQVYIHKVLALEGENKQSLPDSDALRFRVKGYP